MRALLRKLSRRIRLTAADAPAVQRGCVYCMQWQGEPHDQWCSPRSTSALPVHDGPAGCPNCWTPRGKTHELSCPEVSVEQMRAEFDRLREEWAQWDRRDRWMGTAGWALLAAVVLLAAALVWLVTR